MAKYTIHFDGSCWVNPGGKAAFGYTIDKEGVETSAVAGIVGEGTGMSNNVAEFYALLAALWELKPSLQKEDRIEVFGDSMLVINVMNGKWSPKGDKLYYDTFLLVDAEVWLAKLAGVEFSFSWIPREGNTRCDDLSKEHNNAPK
jgi:ribonuclease HI